MGQYLESNDDVVIVSNLGGGTDGGDIIFSTVPAGSTDPVERGRISSAGTVSGLLSGAHSVAYRLASDGVTVTAYDKLGATVSSDADIGNVLNAVFAVMPAAGATIALRNDGNVFPLVNRVLLPKRVTNQLYIQGNGATIQIQASAPTPTVFKLNRTADYDTFQNIRIENLVVDRNSIVSSSPTVISNSSSSAQRINVNGLVLSNITVVNCPNGGSNTHINIASHHLGASETQTQLQNIRIEHIHATGGVTGIVVIGTNATGGAVSEVYLDNIIIRDVYWDSGTTPVSSGGGAGVQIGSLGYGNRCLVQDCYLANSNDVGVEIDGMQDAVIDNVEAVDCFVTGFLVRNFHAASDLDSQVNIIRDCSVRVVSCTAVGLSGVFVNNSSAPTANFGTAIVRNLKMMDGQNPLAIGSGRFIKCNGVAAQRIVVDGAAYTASAISDASVGSKTNNSILIAPNADLLLEMRNVRFKFAGSTSNASMVLRLVTIAPTSSEVSMSLENIWADVAISGVAAGKTVGIGVGEGATGTVRGSIEGFRVVQWTADTGPLGVEITSTSALTIDGRLLIRNCDFSKMPVGCTEIKVDSTQTALGAVVATSNVYKTQPAPVSFTGLSTATGKKLGAQSASVFWPAVVQFQQGTGSAVTAIDYSTDSGTTYTNLVTQASAALPSGPGPEAGPLLPGDLVKVTFTTTQPTIKLIPANP